MAKNNNNASITEVPENNALATVTSVSEVDKSRMFDFSAPSVTHTEDKGRLGTLEVWSGSYKDDKGNTATVTITDKKVVASIDRFARLSAMNEFSAMGKAYELSVIASKKELFKCKSIGEVGRKFFKLQPSTATAYAKVGRLFVTMTEGENGVHYALKPEYEGATVTNLVQVLSLIDEKAEDPEGKLLELMADDKIHITGSLSNLKKELSALKKGETVDEDGNSAIDVKGTVVSEVKANVADSIAVLLAETEKVESDGVKARLLELITEIQSIFTVEYDQQTEDQQTEDQPNEG